MFDADILARKQALRLLLMEYAEQPHDPFTLFNLGHVYHEQVREALSMFQRSLARSQAVDSIVRKLYAMIAQCHRTLGEHAQALAVCKHYPVHPFAHSPRDYFMEDLASDP